MCRRSDWSAGTSTTARQPNVPSGSSVKRPSPTYARIFPAVSSVPMRAKVQGPAGVRPLIVPQVRSSPSVVPRIGAVPIVAFGA